MSSKTVRTNGWCGSDIGLHPAADYGSRHDARDSRAIPSLSPAGLWARGRSDLGDQLPSLSAQNRPNRPILEEFPRKWAYSVGRFHAELAKTVPRTGPETAGKRELWDQWDGWDGLAHHRLGPRSEISFYMNTSAIARRTRNCRPVLKFASACVRFLYGVNPGRQRSTSARQPPLRSVSMPPVCAR